LFRVLVDADLQRTRLSSRPRERAVYGEYGQVTSIEVIPVARGLRRRRHPRRGDRRRRRQPVRLGHGPAPPDRRGIVGGAVAGNAIENRNKRDDEVYRVWVRMDNGSMRSIDFHRVDDLRVGDRVRYDGGQLYRY
jgi:hypothetical protein